MTSPGEIFIDNRDRWALDGLLARVAPSVRVAQAETSRPLGLTRLTLDGVPVAAAALVADADTGAALAAEGVPGEVIGAAADPSPSAGGSGADCRCAARLDVLLAALRHAARTSYDGWVPLLDRDTDDGSVETSPHVKIGAALLPEDTLPEDGDRVVAGAPTGPRVGIADAQIFAHDDLAGHYLGEPWPRSVPLTSLAPGHAAFVAGLVLRRQLHAQLVCRTVLAHGGPNRSWDVAGRLVAFGDDDLDVLNMSFGCLTTGTAPLPLRRATDLLCGRTVLVAAVGNHRGDAPTRPIYPAAFPTVLAVGASAPGDAGAAADDTPVVPWLDLLAPGVDVVGPFVVGDVQVPASAPARAACACGAGLAADDTRDLDPQPVTVRPYTTGYATWSGSSLAAATVTGQIARIMADRGVDAFTARDELLAGAAADIVPFNDPAALDPVPSFSAPSDPAPSTTRPSR